MPIEILKAQACFVSTGLLLKAFHHSEVTANSLLRIEALAVAHIETISRFDEQRLRHRKTHLPMHCTESVDSAGQAQNYTTAPFENRHRTIR